MGKKLTLRISIISILFLLSLFSIYFLYKENRQGILTVAFLNIGQGDAIFIDAPNGNQMLIDGGPGKSVLRELGAVLPFYDRSIDVVLATHADQDHVGGLPDVLQNYKADYFMETGNPGPSSSYEELERIIQNKNIEKFLARRGMVVDLGKGVKLEILFPDRDVVGMETNTSSIVARLVHGENEFLLTGDSPKSIESYLVSLEDALQGDLETESDVLKLGHHGSKTSSGEEFVKTVSPEYSVISVGLNNRYGHPHQEVLDTINKLKIKILRTDLDGRIIFKSNGNSLELEAKSLK